MNKSNGTRIIDEQQHIRQSIADILQTPIGSRIQRRDYGSILPLLIDRPISHVLALQIASASIIALKKWEPRIEISYFNVQFDRESKYRMTADITATTRTGDVMTIEQLGLLQ